MSRATDQIGQYKNLSSNTAISASSSAPVRLVPDFATAAVKIAGGPAAYQLWLLLRHIEGRSCSGLLRYDRAISQLNALRKHDWQRSIREAASLTRIDGNGLLCGFLTVFSSKDGTLYIRRHSEAHVTRLLKPEHVGRAVVVPVSEILSTVPKFKRAMRVLAVSRRHRKGVRAPQSQARLARQLGCHRSTLSRNLGDAERAGRIERVANTEIVGVEEEPGTPLMLDGTQADTFVKGKNREWYREHVWERSKAARQHDPNCTNPHNLGPYAYHRPEMLGEAVTSKITLPQGFYIVTKRLPSLIIGKIKTGGLGYMLRLRKLCGILSTSANAKPHMRRDEDTHSVYAETPGMRYLLSCSTSLQVG